MTKVDLKVAAEVHVRTCMLSLFGVLHQEQLEQICCLRLTITLPEAVPSPINFEMNFNSPNLAFYVLT